MPGNLAKSRSPPYTSRHTIESDYFKYLGDLSSNERED
jgi:hypothetical protein